MQGSIFAVCVLKSKDALTVPELIQWILFFNFKICSFMKKKLSFAARLRAGQDAVAFIESLTDYIPLREEESKESLNNYVMSVAAVNDSITNLIKEKKLLTKERMDIFYTGTNSVTKNFITIKANVRHQYGRNSGQMELLNEISYRMKSVKAEKVIPLETSAENTNAEDQQLTELQVVKPGERTFASLTKNFNDFVTTLESLEDYKPLNNSFTIENLKAIGTKLNKLNTEITLKELELRSRRQARFEMYQEMENRIERVKFSIRAKYGANSSVYKQIRTKGL